MKGLLFAILLLLSPTALPQEDLFNPPISIETPSACVPYLTIAAKVIVEYARHNTPAEELKALAEELRSDPNVEDFAVDYMIDTIDLVYGVNPTLREDVIAIYKMVIARCVYDYEAKRRVDEGEQLL